MSVNILIKVWFEFINALHKSSVNFPFYGPFCKPSGLSHGLYTTPQFYHSIMKAHRDRQYIN